MPVCLMSTQVLRSASLLGACVDDLPVMQALGISCACREPAPSNSHRSVARFHDVQSNKVDYFLSFLEKFIFVATLHDTVIPSTSS